MLGASIASKDSGGCHQGELALVAPERRESQPWAASGSDRMTQKIGSKHALRSRSRRAPPRSLLPGLGCRSWVSLGRCPAEAGENPGVD